MYHAQQNKRIPTEQAFRAPGSVFRDQRGFTLVEMIVAIFIFSIVMVIATGSLITVIGANRKAQAVKSVMNNLNFSLDSMARAIRVGTDYDCGVSACAVDGSSEFSFIDTDGREVMYRLNDETSRIERSVDGGTFLTLTAPEVVVEYLRFYADGFESNDGEQPRVLIVLGGTAGETERTRTTFNLQTMVSQRILDR